jgi:hypothetical protein
MATNSTIDDNSAGNGAGIGNIGPGYAPVTVIDSTISGNFDNVGGGGGVYVSVGFVGIAVISRSTIIAGNTAPGSPDFFGVLNSQGHNLIGNGSGGSGFIPTDLVGTAANPIDPRLGPLQNNGGATQTMALLRGSPAIDAGDNTGAPMWDQRGPGFPRIEHGIIDIGAFEYHFRQPQLDPVPLQAMPSVNSPLFGVTPALPAEVVPLLIPGSPDGQAEEQASPALATALLDLPAPRTFSPSLASTGQPRDPVAGDLDLELSQQWRI